MQKQQNSYDRDNLSKNARAAEDGDATIEHFAEKHIDLNIKESQSQIVHYLSQTTSSFELKNSVLLWHVVSCGCMLREYVR